LTGTWLTLQAAAQASISGTAADDHMGAYCVSKAGVDMLVKVAAMKWGRYVIHADGGLALHSPIDVFGHGQQLARKP
jgi:hypothetical protein